MKDLVLIGLVVLGLWFWEGWIRVPQGTWIFRCHRKGWEAKGTRDLLGKGLWSWLWLPPWIGRNKILLAQGMPISLSVEAVWLHSSQAPNPGPRAPGEGAVVGWEEVEALKNDPHRIRYQGKAQGLAMDSALLTRLRKELNDLAQATDANRGAALDAWTRELLAAAPVRRRLRRLERLTEELRFGIAMYAGWLLVVVPTVVHFRGWEVSWPFMLFFTLVMQVVLGCMARQAHVTLLPRHAEERMAWVIACYLSPPALLRSCEQLAAKVTADVHPVALALALDHGGSKAREEFLGRLARDLRSPCQPIAVEPTEVLLRIDREHRERILAQMEKLARYPIASTLEAKVVDAPSDTINCPRCDETYRAGSETCADCGLALERRS